MVLIAARAVLILIFALSGIAKLANRRGTRQSIGEFGLPPRLAALVAIILPLLELATAFALILGPTVALGAAMALLLLLLFIAVIGLTLFRGKSPACNCFGNFHSSEIGPFTILRNSVLALLAGFVLWGEWAGDSVVGGGQDMQTGLVAVGCMLVISFVVAVGWLWWNQRQMTLRIVSLEEQVNRLRGGVAHGSLSPGSLAPDFTLESISGETVSLDSLRDGRIPVILIFSSPHCFACSELLPYVAAWQRDYANVATFAIVSDGSVDSNREKSNAYGLEKVLVQRDTEVADAYKVEGTPSCVVIDPDGTISSPLASGTREIFDLVSRTIEQASSNLVQVSSNGHQAIDLPDSQPPIAVGERAPSLRLAVLDGTAIDLATLRGHPTLIVFWKPDCHFSQHVLHDLKDLERNARANTPHLLVISTGNVEDIRAAGIQSPVAIDPTYDAPRQFGVLGTPAAVLIDADGRIATRAAIGSAAVRAFVRAQQEAALAGAVRENGRQFGNGH